MKKSGKTKKRRRKRIWPFIAVLTAVFVLSTALSFYYFRDKFAFESSFLADIESRHADLTRKEQVEASRRLYGSIEDAGDAGEGIVYRKDTLLVVTEDTIREQMKPYGVDLLDLYLDRNGVIYIDLSAEIRKNFHGDASQELGILSGLYRGIKSNIPGLTAMKILIEGSEAESFGGHIDISRPLGEDIAGAI